MSNQTFPSFEDLVAKISAGHLHGIPCTLATDGFHHPITFFMGTTPIEVTVNSEGQIGFSAADVCKALCVSPSEINEIDAGDKADLVVWRDGR